MSEAETAATPAAEATLPDGEYAIVEMLGHRTLVGRVVEIERFGTKMMQIEPLFRGELLGPILTTGGSVYMFTPCTKEVAAKRCPQSAYQLPPSIAAVAPVPLLAAAEAQDEDEDEVPF